MFSLKSWKRLAPLLLFFLGYSLLFFLWVKTFLYTLPFLAGFLIALAVQPVIGFLQKRLKLPHGPATLAATILALVVLCGGLALLGCWPCGKSPPSSPGRPRMALRNSLSR